MTAEVVGSFVPRVVRAPDRDALFEAFYQRYHPCVLGFAWRAFGAADAEDIAQETMARAYLHFERLDPNRDPWPWLSVVARHVGTDIVRLRARTVAVDDNQLAAVPGDDRDAPHSRVVAEDERAALCQALAQLSATDRQVLRLREYDDLAVADIAALLDRSETAVRQQLFRARRRLAERFRAVAAGTPALLPVIFVKVQVRRAWKFFGQTAHAIAPATAGSVLATSSLLTATGLAFMAPPAVPANAPRLERHVAVTVPAVSVVVPDAKVRKVLPVPAVDRVPTVTVAPPQEKRPVFEAPPMISYNYPDVGRPIPREEDERFGVDTPVGRLEAGGSLRRYRDGPICEAGIVTC